MTWARKRKKVPSDYGRPPKRREIGFAQYVSDWKQAKTTNNNNQA